MSASADARVDWEIGCFNRPWTKWPLAVALKEMKAAGFRTVGLVSRLQDEPIVGSEAAPVYLEGLKKRLAASGLRFIMAALRSRHDGPVEECVADLKKQIDNARFLGLKSVMTFGVDPPAQFEHFITSMREAASYGADKGVGLVMKPHGGVSATAADMVRVVKEIGSKNFSIWYDAGNIVHYTGRDPVAEIDLVAPYLTGFVAKDCAGPKGEVMMQFGQGKVDFPGVLRRLKSAGFKGPVMVESCRVGATPEETTANARANREFLEKVLAEV